MSVRRSSFRYLRRSTGRSLAGTVSSSGLEAGVAEIEERDDEDQQESYAAEDLSHALSKGRLHDRDQASSPRCDRRTLKESGWIR